MLTGISGSAGIIRGRARIVRDPSLAPQDLSREDILVVPFTDVGWTPLLAGIGGIVAETGGQLSHTAIVAREYGLPAVVSVKHATQLLREGQLIVVDGGLGCVYLKQEAVI
jgi:pyruvate,water dikinase